jgi:hypothetical protein
MQAYHESKVVHTDMMVMITHNPVSVRIPCITMSVFAPVDTMFTPVVTFIVSVITVLARPFVTVPVMAT